MNLFSPDNLFQVPTGNPPAAFGIVPGIFGAIFLFSAIAYWRRSSLAPDNPVLRRLIRRAATAGLWTSVIGLFLAAMRYVQFDYLDMPILIYLLALLMIGIAGYFVYDRSENYPIAVWKLRESQVGRRYRPAPRPRQEPQRPRPTRARGKRKR